jgi:hypothetical protein
MAAAGVPDIKERLLNGHQAGDKPARCYPSAARPRRRAAPALRAAVVDIDAHAAVDRGGVRAASGPRGCRGVRSEPKSMRGGRIQRPAS